MISCGARLAVFDIAELREVTAYDELELDTLGDRKTALFLIMSDTDDSFNFLISMCYTQLFMKKHGHYCKVCGEYKANEKFSGKGHASHICKSCASLPAEKQAELMTLNRLLNLPWRLSKEQLSWLKNRLKDRRPDVRALAQEQYEMRFPPRHLEDDEFNFFDEESFIE